MKFCVKQPISITQAPILCCDEQVVHIIKEIILINSWLKNRKLTIALKEKPY